MRKFIFSFVFLMICGCTLIPLPEQDPLISCDNINKYVKIVYEDENVIIANKPADMMTVSDSGDLTASLSGLLEKQAVCSNAKPRKYYSVHHLDRDTSGMVVFAKDQASRKALQDQFAAHEVAQGYRTVVEGVMEQDKGVLAVTEKGGETTYSVLRKLPNATYMELQTQGMSSEELRKQLGLSGHPVFADRRNAATYSGEFSEKYVLQAYYIRFQRPFTKEILELTLTPSDNILEAIDFAQRAKK